MCCLCSKCLSPLLRLFALLYHYVRKYLIARHLCGLAPDSGKLCVYLAKPFLPFGTGGTSGTSAGDQRTGRLVRKGITQQRFRAKLLGEKKEEEKKNFTGGSGLPFPLYHSVSAVVQLVMGVHSLGNYHMLIENTEV